MTRVQVLLIGLLLGVAVLYFARLRSQLLDRLLVLAISAVMFALVLRPSFTQTAADYVGVGRGADLVIYVGFLGVGFAATVLLSKVRVLERQVTELARWAALSSAVNQNTTQGVGPDTPANDSGALPPTPTH